jgi:hypothetical protein
MVQNRHLARVESLLGVFMALLIPTMLGSGFDLVKATASLL